MQVEVFDEKRLFETGRLFSDRFEDRTKYVYHGTSTLYSPALESAGFQYPFISVPAAELEALASTLPPENAELASTLRGAVKPTRLGFAPYSFWAVEYAQMGGGQVLSLCRDAVKNGAKPLSGGVVEARLRDFDAAQGCVYAIDLSRAESTGFVFERMFFQSTSAVPGDWLVGKVLIPREFEAARLKELQGRFPLWKAPQEPGSMAAKFKPIPPAEEQYISEFV